MGPFVYWRRGRDYSLAYSSLTPRGGRSLAALGPRSLARLSRRSSRTVALWATGSNLAVFVGEQLLELIVLIVLSET